MSARLRCLLILPLLIAITACDRKPAADTAIVTSAEAVPASAPMAPADLSSAARQGQLPVLEILSEGGQMRGGVLMVDAYERDRLYLGVALETEAGQPIAGEALGVTATGDAHVLLRQARTDGDGYSEFELLVGQAGQQTVTVTAAGVSQSFTLNVLPNDFDQWLGDLPQAGLTRWGTLMETSVVPGDQGLEARFPPAVRALAGQRIRVAGFMLPLDPTPGQTHFLLSASPPNCFFHVPGGPSTVIEVFADKPVPGSFDPLVVEGRLELIEVSEQGILFRLQAAAPG